MRADDTAGYGSPAIIDRPLQLLDHITFIFNFFDELQRIAPSAKN